MVFVRVVGREVGFGDGVVGVDLLLAAAGASLGLYIMACLGDLELASKYCWRANSVVCVTLQG